MPKRILRAILYLFSVLVILFIFSIALGFLGYRITTGGEITLKREIKYQLIDLIGFDAFRALLIEPLAGKRRVFVINEDGGTGWFYISPEDNERVWPKNLYEIDYTLEVTFKTKKLLFGGYAPAQVVEIQKVDRKPRISK